MKKLQELRAKWEKTPDANTVIHTPHGEVLVAIEDDLTSNPQLYRLNRYFKLGGEWQISVDQDGATVENLLEWVEEYTRVEPPVTRTRTSALKSRYGTMWPLEVFQQDGTWWAIVNFDEALYMRSVHKAEQPSEIAFIDPDGGPFIGEGFPILVSEEEDPELWSSVVAIEHEKDGKWRLQLDEPSVATKSMTG